MSISTKFLTLKTCDGKEFVHEEAIVVSSQTIKNMVEDDCVSNAIPLPNVHSKTMTKVIEYWKKHLEDGVSKDMLMDFDKAFVNVHHSILHALILAANFLNDKEILYMMCQEVADWIKEKTPEEIRKEFDIKNDYTPEEEKEIHKENDWPLNDFIWFNIGRNIDGKKMTKVVQYWKKYLEEGVTEDQLKSFEQDFLKMSQSELVGVLLANNFFDDMQ
ncbi:SKP1-like protein 11 [Solanum tuberosum]|uniref:SKP1-like protein 11 n=1 Tax=Solanum tuberosum TaxID=4113 RepID=UPI00073A49D3|nr:PREDICTED: SKP1-like protein 11 [Solanum tuberosum]